MKKLLWAIALFIPSMVFGADAANDLIMSQRKADNSGNIQRNVAPVASGFFTFDASKLPKSSALGTGVETALGVAVGSAGAPVVNGGALGTPSSGVGTNLTALNATNLSTGTVASERLPSTITAATTFSAGTASTSTNTGTVIISGSGGLGVGGAGYFGGILDIRPSTNVTQLFLRQDNSASANWGLFCDSSDGSLQFKRTGAAASVSISASSVASFVASPTVSTSGYSAVSIISSSAVNGAASVYQTASDSNSSWTFGKRDDAIGSAPTSSLVGIYGASSVFWFTKTGGLNIKDTTASTNTTTGALTVAGGIGAAGRISSATINVGGTNGTTIDLVASASATLDFGSISAASSADLTITVTGASTGDTVHLGLPSAPAAGIIFNAFVSASNTVTVRAFNITAAPVDPASASYRAAVMSF